MSSRQRSQLAFGLFLIALGLISLGERPYAVHIGRLWPVFLIIFGVGRFTAPREDGRHRNGLWLVFLGALFLLNNYDIFPFTESWPLFIVAAGLSLIFGGRPTRPAGQSGERLQP